MANRKRRRAVSKSESVKPTSPIYDYLELIKTQRENIIATSKLDGALGYTAISAWNAAVNDATHDNELVQMYLRAIAKSHRMPAESRDPWILRLKQLGDIHGELLRTADG